MSLSDAAKEMNHWLATDGRNLKGMVPLLKEYVPKLRNSYGIQVDRIFTGCKLIHPQAGVWNWKYESATPTDVYTEHTISKHELEYIRTNIMDPNEPFTRMDNDNSIEFIRHRATDVDLPKGSMTELFRDKGFTDLYALPNYYRGQFQLGTTWATKREGGFSDDEIGFFEATKDMFNMVILLRSNDLVLQSLLCTYLGKDPGMRVHQGSVTRGDGISVRSVVWFSDVRGFTSMSCVMDRDEVIDLINDVFEVTETVLSRHEGEILKFMGDGVLAIFTGSDDEGAGDASLICDKATKAAREFQIRLKERSEQRKQRGLPGAEVGIGLHYGDCSYGNVGGPSRLDFTVIGSSVNLASRVEGLCSKLHASILATSDFVDQNQGRRQDWMSRGEHALKGVIDKVTVFELDTSS